MHLDRDDEKMLHGEYGETCQKMMEILVALGKVFGADRLIPITSAQVSGASYKTIGEWGLKWLESLQAKVAVPTILNPVGMPREGWEEIGISRDFAEKQLAIIEAYRHLGVRLECTCTPYYLHMVKYGEHLAWAESSAVVYANSVIGARTNREGGPSALAAAIVGKTPNYGLHHIGNRCPSIAFTLDGGGDLTAREDVFGAIGYIAGKKAGAKIPLFTGIRPRREELKSLGAAMAATGAVSIFHVEGLTPEARIFKYESRNLETITIDKSEVDALFGEMEVDAVAIGCPHCSPDELITIARLLKGTKVKKPLFIFASREVIRTSKAAVDAIIRSGAKVIPDTCMVVSPFMEQYRSIMVDSGKALAYVPSMCGALARLGTRTECIRVATSSS
ncbi:MAG: aconitase X catalytic domain-containing protein [Methanomicrobiales archaeon]|nr:aconitase X catalytic domain-containing protein [Methanomicrobiales archaeon]